MPTQIHHELPRGSQIELLNVQVAVGRRDEEPDADYIVTFEDHKGQVKVYVPMSPDSFRKFVEGMNEHLSKVVLPSKIELVRP